MCPPATHSMCTWRQHTSRTSSQATLAARAVWSSAPVATPPGDKYARWCTAPSPRPNRPGATSRFQNKIVRAAPDFVLESKEISGFDRGHHALHGGEVGAVDEHYLVARALDPPDTLAVVPQRVVLLEELEALLQRILELGRVSLGVPARAHDNQGVAAVLVQGVARPSPALARLGLLDEILPQHDLQIELAERVGLPEGPARAQCVGER